MRRPRCVFVATAGLALLGLSGCTAPLPSAATEKNAPGSATSTATSSATPASARSSAAADSRSRPLATEGETVRLPAFKLQEWPISDFGLSVKTNFEVVQNGNVQWMEVSAIEPGGPAINAGLQAGDRILAIDDMVVTKLDRAGLLEVLFQRKPGDRVRLLVASRHDAFPHFVSLVSRRPAGS